MAREPAPDAADHNEHELRRKYLVLCRKYSALVERLERRSSREASVFQLGRWGMHMRDVGLALVANGRIEIENARFTDLAELIRLRAAGDPPQPLSSLRALVLREAELAIAERGPRTTRLPNYGQGHVLLLSIDYGLRGSRPIALAMLEDVTNDAMNEEELGQRSDLLLQRERVRVLGQLAAAVAHDLGSTLRGASFQLASLRPAGLRQRSGALQGAIERLEIASEIVNRLHDFAQSGSVPDSSPVRLARVLRKAIAVADLEKASGKTVKVVASVPELPPVRGNEAELSFLFVNLLRNARDAMSEGGTVQITARRSAQGVRVTVADNGPGIPARHLTSIFAPFFTTKGRAGSGLGLWLAKSAMTRIGGDISVSNRRNGGASFVVDFPLISPSEARPRPVLSAPASPAARRSRRAPRSGRRS